MTASEGIRLRLLGVPAVEARGDRGAGVLSQPKRLALLAYLAVQGGFVRRDVLVEMFWSDSDPERARRALSQATHTLRRSLGRSAIRSRGNEELGISTEHVWIDVRAFEAAIAGERLEEAVELHRGELLHGLSGDSFTADFSHWLDAERLRLQRSAARAAKRLADDAFRAGDVAGAIAWQRRAVDVRPLDEAMFRDYLALLDEAGDAALALSEYDSFRTRLAAEFDLEPARETVRLIEMIRSQRPECEPASRTAANEAAVAAAFPAAEPAPIDTGGHGPPHNGRPRRLLRLGPVVLGVIAFLVIVGYWLNEPEPGDASPVVVNDRIAVLYLQPLSDSVSTHIADGITTALIEHLSGYSEIGVVPSSAVLPFRGTNPDRDTLIARLNAAFYLTGNVRRLGDQTQVLIELTRADGTPVFAQDTTFASSNVITIAEAIIGGVVNRLPLIGDEVRRREIRYGTDDSIAASQVLRAMDLERRAVEHAVPPSFSGVPGLLADADSFLTMAIRNDPRWPDPYLNRGRLAKTRVQLCYPPFVDCEWQPQLQQAIEDATRAIQLDPDHAGAYELRADLRWMTWQFGVVTDTAVLSEIVDDAHAAIRRGGRQPLAHMILSLVHNERGEWDEAYRAAQVALTEDEFSRDKAQHLTVLFEAAFNAYNDSAAAGHCNALNGVSSGFRPIYCTLRLMAWSPHTVPDPGEAERLVTRYLQDMKGKSRMQIAPQAELLQAAVLARTAIGNHALEESVAQVVRQLVNDYPQVEDRLLYAAEVLARLNRADDARAYLDAYVVGSPAKRSFVSTWRVFDNINFITTELDPAESRPGRDPSRPR